MGKLISLIDFIKVINHNRHHSCVPRKNLLASKKRIRPRAVLIQMHLVHLRCFQENGHGAEALHLG